MRRAVSLDAVASVVSAEFGESLDDLRARGRHGAARGAAIYRCRDHVAASVGRLGEWSGGVGPAAIAEAAAIERSKCLLKPMIMIESSQRPATVMDRCPSVKSRLNRMLSWRYGH